MARIRSWIESKAQFERRVARYIKRKKKQKEDQKRLGFEREHLEHKKEKNDVVEEFWW